MPALHLSYTGRYNECQRAATACAVTAIPRAKVCARTASIVVRVRPSRRIEPRCRLAIECRKYRHGHGNVRRVLIQRRSAAGRRVFRFSRDRYGEPLAPALSLRPIGVDDTTGANFPDAPCVSASRRARLMSSKESASTSSPVVKIDSPRKSPKYADPRAGPS